MNEMEVIIILGNHDMICDNNDISDSLTSILEDINWEKLYYLKYSG